MERKTENKNAILERRQTTQNSTTRNLETKDHFNTILSGNAKKPKRNPRKPQKTKLETALVALIENPQGLTTEDARRLYGDTCLHTTISDFKKKFAIVAKRKNVPLNNQFRTHVMRYWFSDDDMDKAKRIVDQLRAKRGKKPLYHDINVMY